MALYSQGSLAFLDTCGAVPPDDTTTFLGGEALDTIDPQLLSFNELLDDTTPLKWEQEEEEEEAIGVSYGSFCGQLQQSMSFEADLLSSSPMTSSSPISSSPSSPPSYASESEGSISDSSEACSPQTYGSSGESVFFFDSLSPSSPPVCYPSFEAPTSFALPINLDTVTPSLIHDVPTTTTTTTVTKTSVNASGKRRATAAPKTDTQNKRKRARKEPEPTSVSLPRAVLLKISSAELEEHVARLRATRQLSPAEEKDIGRQRRLVKNRESASLSRARRKEHMDELEAQVNELSVQNSELQDKVEELTAENIELKEKLKRYESSPSSPASPPSTSTSTPASGRGASIIKALNDWTKINGKQTTLNKSAAAAGACLAIILFSFGLFFNTGLMGNPALKASFTTSNPQLPPIMSAPPQPLPVSDKTVNPLLSATTTKSSSDTKHRTHTNSDYLTFNNPLQRKLFGICEEEESELGSACQPIVLDDIDEKPISTTPSTTTTATKKVKVDQERSLAKPRTHTYLTFPQFCDLSSLDASHNNNNPAATPAPQPEDPDNSVDAGVLNGLRAAGQSILPSNSHNQTFLLCPQARQIKSEYQQTNKVELDSMLTILVPPSAIGYTDRDIAALSSSWTPPPPSVQTMLQVRTYVNQIRPLCFSAVEASKLSSSSAPISCTH